MTWNETGDWVFSDEYHEWQDKQNRSTYRSVNEHIIQTEGWRAGLWTYKPQAGEGGSRASWPVPDKERDLDVSDAIAGGLYRGGSTQWML